MRTYQEAIAGVGRAGKKRQRPDPAALFELFGDLANERVVQYQTAAPGGPVVKLRQNPEIENSTGGIVWETSYLLSTFLEHHGLVGRGSRVLEVGAGCGLCGMVLAHHGCRVALTEAAEALPTLERNVAANTFTKAGGGEAVARLLRWDVEADRAPLLAPTREGWGGKGKDDKFDFVIGTDVVFSAALVQPMLDTIASMCHEGTKVWLCLQERCSDAHALLKARMPEVFRVVRDRSSDLAETPGCGAAEDLECFLFELEGCKRVATGALGACVHGESGSAEPEPGPPMMMRQGTTEEEGPTMKSKTEKKKSKKEKKKHKEGTPDDGAGGGDHDDGSGGHVRRKKKRRRKE